VAELDEVPLPETGMPLEAGPTPIDLPVATNSAIMRASSRSFLARTPHALATWGIADPTASSIKRKQVLMSELGPEIFPEIAFGKLLGR